MAAASALGATAPLRTALQEFEAQLDRTLGALENKVLDSQQQTFDHLLLYEGAVQELQVRDESGGCGRGGRRARRASARGGFQARAGWRLPVGVPWARRSRLAAPPCSRPRALCGTVINRSSLRFRSFQSTTKEAAHANDELSAACEVLEASSVDVEPALLRLLALSELTKKLVAGVAKLDDI